MSRIEVLTLETPGLGDRSYLAHDGEVALVVDPQRDIDRVLGLAERAGVRITDVLETHVHNDYLTGGLALAERTGAAYHVSAEDPVAFACSPIHAEDRLSVGGMAVRAVATPGHTYTHLSYVLEEDGAPVAAFTGGSLLYGATGRPDLLGPEHTDELAHLQYRSAHRLARELPGATPLYPTHGFGSFCTSSQSPADESTIAREQADNPVLTSAEQEYVDGLLTALDAYPAYYAHMAPRNLAGPDAPDLSPPEPTDPARLRRSLAAGEWVVDLRTRTAFAAGHLPGSLNFGLDGAFATYVGWLIDWGTPVTLLGETAEDVATAQRELVRIGIDRPAAAATGGPADWVEGTPAELPLGSFADLARARRDRPVAVLDVRRRQEAEASRIEDSVNLPVHEVPRRLGDVPAGEVWVHCGSGYRAAVAASFLAAAGHRPVLVDDAFDNAASAGLPLVGPDA